MPEPPRNHRFAHASKDISMSVEASLEEEAGTEITPLPLRKAKAWTDYAWSAVGIIAVLGAGYMLYKELAGISPRDISRAFALIPRERWVLAILGTLVAYAALAWYDRIALLHLGKPLNWLFISLTSFTTYALSHNIGASVFSGAAVRYRAYSTKGLTATDVGVLVVLTAFTFMLGTILLGGLVLVGEPQLVARLLHVDRELARAVGFVMLGAVALYVFGSLFEFPALNLGSCKLSYPRPPIVLRQLIAAPLELLGAAAIIYFAMPAHGNPGYFVVLGVFLASFSVALISHAPGGLGVLEFIFIKAMPDVPKTEVIVALIVFRLLYLIVPLVLGLVVVRMFEKGRLAEALRARSTGTPGADPEPRTPQAPAPSNVVHLKEAARQARGGVNPPI
jgi:glycosyltransferase 2 family protein